VAHRFVQRTVEAVGTLHGFEEVAISAKVEGRVRRLLRDVADRVKPGELLLEIDPTDYELAVRQADKALHVELAKLGSQELPEPGFDVTKVPSVLQARARMENAQVRMQRAQTAGVGASREDLADKTADYRVAEAEYQNQILLTRAGLATVQMKHEALAIARQQLKDTQISGPTPTLAVPGAENGVTYVVTHRPVAEGSFVRPGTEVFRLVIDRTLKLRVPVPERYSPEVRLGQKADVHTAAYAHPFAGTVTRINPAVEPATRTFEVEIQIPNPDGVLKPGGFAKAAILTRVDQDAVTVPLAALSNFAGITKVFVAEDGKAKEVQVTLGVQTTEWVEIAKPALPRGAQVVTSGQSALADGSAVTVRQAK
jgi:RND family efflux transporter MFP subunit